MNELNTPSRPPAPNPGAAKKSHAGAFERAARGVLACASTALVACSVPADPQPGAAGTAAGGGGAGTPAATAGSGGVAPSSPLELESKAIHRLSNLEYDNTLRDLTGTSRRFEHDFVSEEVEGFDNIAAGLSVSPRQLEDYFEAARQVSAEVFGSPTLRAQVVTCTPDATTACAEKVIGEFGRRAFRRPLTTEESTRLLSKYQAALTLGVDSMGALQHLVHVILSSPQFLYRIEVDPDPASATPHPLDGYELASRLSYALWSTMPDEELLAQAAGGALASAEGLVAQVDRMLSDGRSEMLVKNFAARWFGSKRLDDHVASVTAFPEYDAQLAVSMQREMELYFSEFLYEDRPYTDFLTADFNFVDAPLAKLYGFAPPAEGMQRVVNETDQRVGLLGLAGFLTHTSRETRSSPIIRGKWVLDAVLCTPLVVPAGLIVSPLEEPGEGSAPTTVRQQMEAHRVSPACSGCHNLMDPIGLALENFDAIGKYRPIYENGLPIDTVGTMPDGTKVDGLPSLVSAIAKSPKLLPCAANKLGTYALGAHASVGSVEQIVARWTAGAPTLRRLLKEVVTHESFTSRKAESL
ncbi:MAG: hypothetical protein K0R38_4607 [Polyangiaceae bacterium]|jgi:hypothetical protein|nr:hypothetical protein [Polyangiaceae bacterium]